jgi:8-oxo-dGTP pyrophosphatase MutT (NUDIX family)
MRIIKEIRKNDLSIRVGIVISDGQYILVEQPTNMLRKGWKLDIPKGHLQKGESPIQGAIRETYEETNIKFEPWKLTFPIQTTCNGTPLFLFLAKIDELIPVNLLSCVSTFVDEDGIRKPEVEAYYWLNPRTQIYLMQDRLIPGIKYYFSKQKYIEKEFENCCQTTGGIAGSIPPNINKILSLGYKSGTDLSSPKGVKKSQDYSNIPDRF